MAPQLSHLFLHVTDLERSRRFYTEVIGLDVLMEHPGYVRVGGHDGFHIGMEQRQPSEVGSAGIEIVIRVDDVHVAYNRMSAAGVEFATEPALQPWGATHAWFVDPDGYRASIYSIE